MRIEIAPERLREEYEGKRRSTQAVAEHFGCSRHTILRRLREFGIPRRSGCGRPGKVPWLNETFFDDLNSDSAYVLGFIVADGYIQPGSRNGFQISQKDEKILDRLSDVMGGGEKRKYKNQAVASLYFTDCPRATNVLKQKYDIRPNKSMTIRLPLVEDVLHRHLIRGYFDGDGSVWGASGGGFKFTSGSRGLLEDVAAVLGGAGIEGGHIADQDLFYHGVLTAIDFGRYIYGEDFGVWGSPLFIERKRERFVRVAKRWRGREWFHKQIAVGASFADMGAELGIRPSIVSRVSKRI